MHRADRVFAIVFLGFGIYMVANSRKWAYWLDFGPGPGYFPLWLGIILIAMGTFLFLASFFLTKDKKEGAVHLHRGSLRVAWLVMAMLICIALMNYLGFCVSVLLFLLVVMESLERKKRMLHIGVMLLTGFILYFVFGYWMGIPFATGIFGI